MIDWFEFVGEVIAAVIFGAVVVALGAGGIWTLFHAVRQTLYWPKVPARILRYHLRRGEDSSRSQPFYHPVFRFDTTDGRVVTNDADRESIRKTLVDMADGMSHMMTSTSSGDRMTVRLSPVRDVESFSTQITFGEVTEVEVRN